MQLSAEIRWFWRHIPPAGLEEWFHSADMHGCAAGGGERRTDEYLRDPGQGELGVKRRGKKPGVEVKGLVAAVPDGLTTAPFCGPIEIWNKLSTHVLTFQDSVSTEKQRWLRKFDTSGAAPEEIHLGEDEQPKDPDQPLPALGCNVEFTRVTCGEEVWWTLGFESFGPLQTVEESLRVVATLLATRRPPDPGSDALRASYPVWLAEVAP
jgi:hypothetical protein